MQIVIPKEKLNNILFPIFDEIYGVLNNEKDNTRYFDEYGEGRVHVRTRKKVGYILFKDFQKMNEFINLPSEIWFGSFIDWFHQNYGVKLDSELSWLSYKL